ncbi:hypothetical protein [Pseudomonas shirazica]|uniref:hypothetical protein n=1 Tax=Pseudomonas shirazica TaxID=1940636 RepID=UPI003AAB96C7
MSGTQLTLLVPKAARDAHAELLAALGTEANPAQWMVFMDAVTRLLPDVLSSGRPSKDAIQRSAIGQLGFTSWQAMIEAPTDASGLGWNFSGWKAWRRAWTAVQAYPWLRQEPLTSSEVNSIVLDCKRDGIQFPGSAGELEAIRQGRKEAQEARKAETTQALTQRAETAEKALQEASALAKSVTDQLAQVQQQLATALGQVAKQAETIGTLKAEKSQVETNRDYWKNKAQAKPAQPAQPQPAPQQLGVWARFMRWLFGSK